MSWWGWALIVWVALSLPGAIVIGKAVQQAELNERGKDDQEPDRGVQRPGMGRVAASHLRVV